MLASVSPEHSFIVSKLIAVEGIDREDKCVSCVFKYEDLISQVFEMYSC